MLRSSERSGPPTPEATAPPVSEGDVRVDAIVHIPAVLRDLGLDPETTLAASGLDARVFDDPANEIPIQGLGRLLRLAVARSGCAHLGLLVGQRSGLGSQGLVGLLARHSPDVGTALDNLSAHLHLRDRGAVAPLHVADGVAMLGYEIYQAGVEAGDQICDGAMAIATNVMRGLCGPTWRPMAVWFAHSPPADLRPFRRFFGAPLHFDAERTALAFPATWLGQRTKGADPALYRALAGRVEALESAMPREVVGELRQTLRAILLTEKGSVAGVAARLSMHRRTLNRRLRAAGTSLHRLLDETRFEIARQLLRYTHMPFTEIAAVLGYSHPSAFTRAFRRWTGRTPSAWRKLLPSEPVAKCQAVTRAAPYAVRPLQEPGRKRWSA